MAIVVGQKQKYKNDHSFIGRLCLLKQTWSMHGSGLACSTVCDVCLNRQFLFLIQRERERSAIKFTSGYQVSSFISNLESDEWPLILDYYFMIFSTDCGVWQLKWYISFDRCPNPCTFMQDMRIYILNSNGNYPDTIANSFCRSAHCVHSTLLPSTTTMNCCRIQSEIAIFWFENPKGMCAPNA